MQDYLQSYYQLLGIVKTSNINEVKKAYKLKAKKLHPDKNVTHDTTKAFQELQHAYEEILLYLYDNDTQSLQQTQQDALQLFEETISILKKDENNYSLRIFYQTLQELALAERSKTINEGQWIIKSTALHYGMNFVNDFYPIDKQECPAYYEKYHFSKKSKKLVKLLEDQSSFTTTVLWDKNKFSSFIEFINTQTNIRKKRMKRANSACDTQWEKALVCHACGSCNIHKKDKWKRSDYEILSCECKDCDMLFQEVIPIDKEIKTEVHEEKLEEIKVSFFRGLLLAIKLFFSKKV